MNCPFHNEDECEIADATITYEIALSSGKIIKRKFALCDGCALSEDDRLDGFEAQLGLINIA